MKLLRRKAVAYFVVVTMIMSLFYALPQTANAEGAGAPATKCTEEGSGTESDPYLLSTAEQLKDLDNTVDTGTTYAGQYFKLKNDIDAGGTLSGPIGTSAANAFQGVFDGDHKAITVEITGDANGGGLFSSLNGATVKDLTVKGSVTGRAETGGIAGNLKDSTISGCRVEAEVTTTGRGYTGGTGGVAGYLTGSNTIENCTCTGTVTVDWDSYNSSIGIGGIAGTVYNGSTAVRGCTNEGNIQDKTDGNTTTAGKGGIVGKSDAISTIEDCVNKGTISSVSSSGYSGAPRIAGIIGATSSDTSESNSIERCVNEGTITNESGSSDAMTGGIIAYSYGRDTVTECINRGVINASAGDAGGIAATMKNYYVSNVESSYNTAAVNNKGTASNCYTGGVVGSAGQSKVSVLSCYNRGQVTSASSGTGTGAVIGKPYSATSINSAYIARNKYLKGTAALGIGGVDPDKESCTSFEAPSADLPEELGSAFKTDLDPQINEGYPILRWQDPNSGFAVDFNISDKETNASINGATITIEGQTPVSATSFELKSGTYQYKVSTPGFKEATGSVTVGRKSMSVDVALEPLKYDYELTVSPAAAAVEMNNDTLGKISSADPVIDKEADTAVYKYQLNDKESYGAFNYKVSCFGYQPQSGEISLSEAGSKTVALAQQEKHDLTIKVGPAAAEARATLKNTEYNVEVKADAASGNEFKYSLPAGEYSYTVKAKGYKTQQGTLKVPDEDTLSLTLEEKPGWDGESIDTDWYTADPDASTFEISEPEELAGLAQLVNYKASGDTVDFQGKTIKLTADINLADGKWTSIGCKPGSSTDAYPFKGTFDGNGHAVRGLNVPGTDKFYQGFFGYTDGATIRDLSVSGKVTIANSGVPCGGLMAAGSEATVENVTTDIDVNATASTSAYIGGICGKAIGGTFTDCTNLGSITGGYQVGGIIGTSYTNGITVNRCVNEGDVTGNTTGTTTSYVSAGIEGNSYKKDTIEYCINKGKISGANQGLGGIVGIMQANDARIQSCYNLGDIESTSDSANVGGILAYRGSNYSSSSILNDIISCYSAGTIKGGKVVGGVLGNQKDNTINVQRTHSNYYLKSDTYKGLGATGMDHDGVYMPFEKSVIGDYTDLIAGLGSDYSTSSQQDYPILKWQDPDSKFDVNFDISYDSKANLGDDQAVITLKDKEGAIVASEEGDALHYALKNGKYTYTIEKKGYENKSGEITVDKAALTEKVTMTAEKYYYTAKIAREADFTLKDANGVEVQRPDYDDSAGGYVYKLYNGKYSYQAKRFGYQAQSGEEEISYASKLHDFSLEAMPVSKVKFDITAAEGSFSGSDPTVLIYSKGGDFDGTLIGTYDADSAIAEGIMFPRGEYNYTIKADGFNTRRGEMTVGADPQTISVEMATKSGWGGEEDVDTDWYTNNPDATSYIIKNESEFAGLAKLVNEGTDTFAGKSLTITKDLDLKDAAWTPIGGYSMGTTKEFSGSLDGGGHSITISSGEFKNNESCFGIFGYINKANISNLVIRGSVKATYNGENGTSMIYAGGLAGYAGSSVITNCYNQMAIDFTATTTGMGIVDIGGLTGWSVGTSYDRCCSITPVSGTFNTTAATGICYAGGLVGFDQSGMSSARSSMTNCYNTGAVTATGKTFSYAGGLIGNLSGDNTYFEMNNCYNTGLSQAAATTAAMHPLIGNGGNEGNYNNNYYLEGDQSEISSNSTAKSDEYMRSAAFAADLGAAYSQNSNGGYPLFSSEAGVHHIAVTKAPEKTTYNDQEDFDDSGMEVTAYLSDSDTIGTRIFSGWSVKDGKNLKPGTTEVTIEYKGVTAKVPITVNQVVHPIANSELNFAITQPEAGKAPQQDIELSGTQADKFSADISWQKGGKAWSGNFEAASYYRAQVTLKAKYVEGDAYYEFSKYAAPKVDGAYEVKYVTEEKNAAGVITTVRFTVTFKATTSASKGLEDKASHLYYEGDTGAPSDFSSYLDDQLTISGIGDKDKTYQVKDLEQLVLQKDLGMEAARGNEKLDGIRLYDFLHEAGMDENLKDGTTVTVYGKDEIKPVEMTIKDLRSATGDEAAILAYGDENNGLPLAKARGPLWLVQKDLDATQGTGVTRIVIGSQEAAETQNITFQANEPDPAVTVKDSYGNKISAASADNVYQLRKGETYKYSITKEGYTVESGEVTPGDQPQTIKVELLPVWDGKTLKEPARDADGYYLIGSAEELMWWNQNHSKDDKVKLTADIALNNGVDNVNKWPLVYGEREDAAFNGVFDGQGHVIHGLYIDRENTYELVIDWSGAVLAYPDSIDQIGMFGYLKDANIKNFGLEGSIHLYDRPDGSLADWEQVGGIAGYVHGASKIENCYTNVDITVEASTETATVGGYPVSGFGDKTDTYIGGIAGSIATNATIDNCYSKGTLIGAQTRRIDIGGIVGGMRSASTKVTNCYSTAKLQAFERAGSDYDSHLGGIAGDPAVWSEDNSGAISGSYALNSEFKGNTDSKVKAGRVSGLGKALSGNYGSTSIKTDGVDLSKTTGADTIGGADITLDTATKADTYKASGWSTDIWNLDSGSYPMLKWQKAPAGSDRYADYTPAKDENGDQEWDGYFSEHAAPPYFKVGFRVNGYNTESVKKFTRDQMKEMARADNEGTLYYSAKSGMGGNAGRAVSEYVYIDSLMKNAGISFKSGDVLSFGTYAAYDYDKLMEDRYYYPGWNDDSSAGAVKRKAVIALKSYGDSYGVTRETLENFGGSTDYLYAYMLTFGQKTPDESTYGDFAYQQVSGTVVYNDAAAANDTVKQLLQSEIDKAVNALQATATSSDSDKVAGGSYYVSQTDHDRYAASIDAARTKLAKETATNGSIMSAVETLRADGKTFEKAKKPGTGADRSKLQATMDTAREVVAATVVSNDGSDVSQDKMWATQSEIDAMNAKIAAAQLVNDNEEATQMDIDNAEFALRCAIADFAADSGNLEALSRQAAAKALHDYVDGLDMSKYRDKEKNEIDTLLQEGLTNIKKAKTTSDISDALAAAKANIGNVKQELDAEKADAIDELQAWKQKSGDYYQTQQGEITKIIDTAVAKINAAASVQDVKAIRDAAVKQLDNVMTKTEVNAANARAQRERAAKIKAFQKKRVVQKKPRAGKKRITVRWKKVKGARGYQVRYTYKKGRRYKSRYVTVKSSKRAYKVIKKLKRGRKYRTRVRAYTKIGGKKVWTKWSRLKKVRSK
ncbi:MAG: PEGA domain-containing protein [Anaerovoracaceae bacterium]|jgi:hypothetical protein